MVYEIEIINQPRNFIFKWKWIVKNGGLVARNKYRDGLLDIHYGIGYSVTKKRAEKLAKQWIDLREKDYKRYNVETTIIRYEK